MKKITAVLLAVILAIAASGCGAPAADPAATSVPAVSVTENTGNTNNTYAEATDNSGYTDVDSMYPNTLYLVPDTADIAGVGADELAVIKAYAEFRLGVDAAVSVDEENKRVIVKTADELPESAAAELTAKPSLTFRAPDGKVVMDGSETVSAEACAYSTEYVVTVRFTEKGGSRFADITEEYLDQTISVYLDDELLSSPTVYAPITDSEAQIVGGFSEEEAADIAARISFAALPFNVKSVKR